jgi:hypothetical protein
LARCAAPTAAPDKVLAKGVALPSSCAGRAARGSRLNQLRSALVADKRAFVRDQAKLGIQSNAEVLTGETGDYPVATQAPVLGVDPAIVDSFVRGRNMTGHRAILRIRRSAFVSLYLQAYIACGKAGPGRKSIPPAAAMPTTIASEE